MVIFGGGSPRSMLVYGIVMIAILAFSYFVIIKPITSSTTATVNHALNQSFHQANRTERQVNRSINQAQRQANRQLKAAGQ